MIRYPFEMGMAGPKLEEVNDPENTLSVRQSRIVRNVGDPDNYLSVKTVEDHSRRLVTQRITCQLDSRGSFDDV